MKTYSSTSGASVNTNQTLKYKKYILDPLTNRLVLNPEWTPEQEAQLKELTKPVKKHCKLKVPLIALLRSHYKKQLPVIFNGVLTPQKLLLKLKEYKQAGQFAKINSIGYLACCIVIHKIKKLYPTQGHIGAVIGITRVWENKTLKALEADKILFSLYRFLCSKLYSISSAIFDEAIRSELAEFFPWIKYDDNKAAVAEFTHSLNLTINLYKKGSLLTKNLNKTTHKSDVVEKNNVTPYKIQDLLNNLIPGLCLKMKAF